MAHWITVLFSIRFNCRRVLVPESGSALQKRVLLLLDHHLYSLLHVGHRLVGLILVGCQRCAGSSIAWSDHPTYHGYPNDGYQQLASARLLYQSKTIISTSFGLPHIHLYLSTKLNIGNNFFVKLATVHTLDLKTLSKLEIPFLGNAATQLGSRAVVLRNRSWSIPVVQCHWGELVVHDNPKASGCQSLYFTPSGLKARTVQLQKEDANKKGNRSKCLKVDSIDQTCQAVPRLLATVTTSIQLTGFAAINFPCWNKGSIEYIRPRLRAIKLDGRHQNDFGSNAFHSSKKSMALKI